MATMKFTCSLLVLLILGPVCCWSFSPQLAKELLAQIEVKTTQNIKILTQGPGTYPEAFVSGQWTVSTTGGWTCGFFPAIMWQLFNFSGNPTWRSTAEAWTAPIANQQYNNGTHDVGFMLFYSFGLGYLLTNRSDYKQVTLHAAQSLSERFSPIVHCTQSWGAGGPYNYHFPVITDNLMNLELLFWAGQNGGNPDFVTMASEHAARAIVDNVNSRGDNATIHVIDYDPHTGAVLSKMNYPQGRNASDACWSRGQAWAIYGYTMAYRYTRNETFLSAAQGTAAYFLSHLSSSSGYVPLWDFTAPAGDPEDSSATAITLSALIELSQYVNEDLSKQYSFYIDAMFDSLSNPKTFYAPPQNGGILLNATGGGTPTPSFADVPMIFGDYYFVEALVRYLRLY